jgi:hypothetical protein
MNILNSEVLQDVKKNSSSERRCRDTGMVVVRKKKGFCV